VKYKILFIALIVSVALNLGAVGMFFIRGCAEREFGPEPHILGEKLDLTPEQRDLMRKNRDEMKEQAEPLRSELDEKRSEVIELMKEPEVDTAKRDELFGEITSLQVQLETLVFDHMHETVQELTPEQREIFFEHLEGKFGPGPGPFERKHPHLRGHRGGEHGTPYGHEGELGHHGPPGYEGEPPPGYEGGSPPSYEGGSPPPDTE
jgi:Spy/CpxP family protein refolding chaperone